MGSCSGFILFFPLWRMDLKMSGFAVEFAGYAWTKAVCGKKICDSKISRGYVWRGSKYKFLFIFYFMLSAGCLIHLLAELR